MPAVGSFILDMFLVSLWGKTVQSRREKLQFNAIIINSWDFTVKTRSIRSSLFCLTYQFHSDLNI